MRYFTLLLSIAVLLSGETPVLYADPVSPQNSGQDYSDSSPIESAASGPDQDAADLRQRTAAENARANFSYAATVPSNAAPIGVELLGRVDFPVPNYFIARENDQWILYIRNNQNQEISRYALQVNVAPTAVFRSAFISLDGTVRFSIRESSTSFRLIAVDLRTGLEDTAPHAILGAQRVRTIDDRYVVLMETPLGPVDYFLDVFELASGRLIGSGAYTYAAKNPNVEGGSYTASELYYDSANGVLSGLIDGHPALVQIQRTPENPRQDPYIRVSVTRYADKDVLVMTTSDPVLSGPRTQQYEYAKGSIQNTWIVAGSVVVKLASGIEVIPDIVYNRTHDRIFLEGEDVVGVKEYLAQQQFLYPHGYFQVKTRKGSAVYVYNIHSHSKQILDQYQEGEGALAPLSQYLGLDEELSYISWKPIDFNEAVRAGFTTVWLGIGSFLKLTDAEQRSVLSQAQVSGLRTLGFIGGDPAWADPSRLDQPGKVMAEYRQLTDILSAFPRTNPGSLYFAFGTDVEPYTQSWWNGDLTPYSDLLENTIAPVLRDFAAENPTRMGRSLLTRFEPFWYANGHVTDSGKTIRGLRDFSWSTVAGMTYRDTAQKLVEVSDAIRQRAQQLGGLTYLLGVDTKPASSGVSADTTFNGELARIAAEVIAVFQGIPVSQRNSFGGVFVHAGRDTSDQVLETLLATVPAMTEPAPPETAAVRSDSGQYFSIQERSTDPETGDYLPKYGFYLVIRNPESGQIRYARLPGSAESYGLWNFEIRAVGSMGTAAVISSGVSTYVVVERNGVWAVEELAGVSIPASADAGGVRFLNDNVIEITQKVVYRSMGVTRDLHGYYLIDTKTLLNGTLTQARLTPDGKQLLYVMTTQTDPVTGQFIPKSGFFMVRYDLDSKQRVYVRLPGTGASYGLLNFEVEAISPSGQTALLRRGGLGLIVSISNPSRPVQQINGIVGLSPDVAASVRFVNETVLECVIDHRIRTGNPKASVVKSYFDLTTLKASQTMPPTRRLRQRDR